MHNYTPIFTKTIYPNNENTIVTTFVIALTQIECPFVLNKFSTLQNLHTNCITNVLTTINIKINILIP